MGGKGERCGGRGRGVSEGGGRSNGLWVVMKGGGGGLA